MLEQVLDILQEWSLIASNTLLETIRIIKDKGNNDDDLENLDARIQELKFDLEFEYIAIRNRLLALRAEIHQKEQGHQVQGNQEQQEQEQQHHQNSQQAKTLQDIVTVL